SVAVTVTSSPLVNAGSNVTVKLPSAPASTLTSPLGVVTVTVEPGSALPVNSVPSSLISRSVGASGAVVSGAVTVASGDELPALSVAVTVTSSPLVNAGSNVTVKLPSAPASTLTSPLGVVTVTVEPGSALPVNSVPSSLISRSVGASGAVVS